MRELSLVFGEMEITKKQYKEDLQAAKKEGLERGILFNRHKVELAERLYDVLYDLMRLYDYKQEDND
jgi:hypothetical protein